MAMVRARRGGCRRRGRGAGLILPNRELQAVRGVANRGNRRQALGRDGSGNTVVHEVHLICFKKIYLYVAQPQY